ncbi:MAG: diphosphomevalonate decarboxylase [Bifidobacteriaceae bacterium]|jgi:diphosphomevalonate decarboxylase|nr:diphosphomevalonate decarboxylase [Bifidobacteriaceae bacterium]MCI1915515.1 diphosphomevalonate decarboxylase [Bifidobacteriaceae bacterium]
MVHAATARAHTNIALIKYWGKKDAALRLPFTSSISMTLEKFYADTSFTLLPSTQESEFILDGEQVSASAAARVMTYVATLQQRHGVSGTFRIESHNHVPISAGLASSSSAFCALAAAFAAAYELDVDRTELSRMARLGSGSATRSVFGGFAKWERGHDDETSVTRPLDEHPSLDLSLTAVEVDTSPKAVPSTVGMRRTAETSPYYPVWVENTEKACGLMERAIAAQDFTRIGELAQQSALDMHALTMTARPGFTYFQPETLAAISTVEALNDAGVECYFTIDAGPNIKVLSRAENVEEIANRFRAHMPAVTLTTTSFGPGVEYLA